jgi:micrococcal nuclease
MTIKHLGIFVGAVVLLLLSPLLVAAQISGKVVRIADGDTFTILTSDKKQIKIRLHG